MGTSMAAQLRLAVIKINRGLSEVVRAKEE